ncbi:hypothetical protein D3C75_996740 [compost metagenome]
MEPEHHEGEKGLLQPDVGDHLLEAHIRNRRGVRVEGVIHHDAHQPPEELGGESGQGGSTVLQSQGEPELKNGLVGSHI